MAAQCWVWLAGSSGVSAVASLLADSKGAFALDECSKLLTFCQSDFAQADMNPEAIERMQQVLNQIDRMETQQEVLSGRSADKDLDKAEKEETKKELSGRKKGLGYMHNCENELVKLIIKKVTRGRPRLPQKAMLDWPDPMTALKWELGTDVDASDSADCRPRECRECS